MKPITDPEILQHFNSGQSQGLGQSLISDPDVLAQFNGEPQGERSFLQKANDAAAVFNENIGMPLGAGAAGIVSGVEKSLASLGNLALMPFTDKRIPYYEPKGQTPTQEALITGGQFVGSMAPVLGVAGKASKLAGAPSLLKDMAIAGGTGFALGGSEENDMYNRFLSAGLGAGITGVAGLGSKAIAKKVGEQAGRLDAKYKGQYNDIFKSLKNSDLANAKLRVPDAVKNVGEKEASKAFSAKLKRSLAEFSKNPNFENAHDLQSILNKSRVGADKDVANLATDLMKRMRGEMSNFLVKNEQPELLKKYIQTTAGYRDEMAPYLTKAVKSYREGKDTPKQLVRSLLDEVKLTGKSKNYSEIPGFGIRKSINELPTPVKEIGRGAAIGAGASGAGLLGLPYAENILEALRKG